MGEGKATHDGFGADEAPDDREYEALVELEELESLLEELEEQVVSGFEADPQIPEELRARMEALEVRNIEQLRERIMHLHAELDRNDDGLTISDS